jgi:GTP-binding protein
VLVELPTPEPTEETEKLFFEKPGFPVVEDKSFTIERTRDGAWRVTGAYIEKVVKMTRWEYYDAVMRFQRILEALGITEALRGRGVQEGDTVHIGEVKLEWSD